MTILRPWMVAAVSVFLMHSVASAQFNMWGSGAYMAQPSCGYDLDMGDEASDIQDELQERARELKDAKADLRIVKSRLSSARASANAKRDLFKMSGFGGQAFNDIEQHINGQIPCCAYVSPVANLWHFNEEFMNAIRQPSAEEENLVAFQYTPVFATAEYERAEAIAAAKEPKKVSRLPAADAPGDTNNWPTPDSTAQIDVPGGQPIPGTIRGGQQTTQVMMASCSQQGGGQPGVPLRAFHPNIFARVCGPGPGELRPEICTIVNVDSVPRGRNVESCARYLDEWVDKVTETKILEDEKIRLEAVVKELEALNKIKKAELREAMREYQRELREGMTEAGCSTCILSGQQAFRPQRTNFWDTLGNVALAGFSIYSGMQTSKYISDNNAKLGYRTDPMNLTGATMTYGWPYINAALSGGLIGGAGRGAFGCSGSAFGGNQFGPMGYGSPMGMMSPYGPMGMNNMWGNPMSMFGTPMGNGMFNPGMGFGFQGGFGMQNYCPTWPCPVNMMNGGLPGYNPMMNGMMGMNPMMGMNGLAGMPGYLTPGFSMGVNPMAQMMGGYNPMMGMMGMNPMGMGNPMMGMYNPMMAGMNNMSGMNPMMNYQMMQMQQQMYQQQQAMYMQQQARAYQNQMAQQQAMSGMYSELNNLMNRIYSAQMQMSTGGLVGFDSSLTPGLYNTGFNSGLNNGGFATTPNTFVPGTYYNGGSIPGTSIPGTTVPGVNTGVPAYR